MSMSQKLHQLTQYSLMKQQEHHPSILSSTLLLGSQEEFLSVRKIPILKLVPFPLWRHNKMMSIFKMLFQDSFQSQGTLVHPGEKQPFVSKFILELLLQPTQNLCGDPIPVQKAAPCSHLSPLISMPRAPPGGFLSHGSSLRHPNPTKIFEGGGKNQKPGIVQRAVWISWAKPLGETQPVNEQ